MQGLVVQVLKDSQIVALQIRAEREHGDKLINDSVRGPSICIYANMQSIIYRPVHM